MILKHFKPEHVTVCAAAIILFCMLMLRPITGVADNGDFSRIMGPTGLKFYLPTNYYFGYVNRLYRMTIGITFGGGYFSTEIPILLAAIFLSQLVHNTWIFDIRYLAAIYSATFLFSLFLIVKYGLTKYSSKAAGVEKWLIAVIPFFIFTDIGYVSYFNSLYGEAVTLVSLLLLVGSFLLLATSEQPSVWALSVFSAAAFIFAGAKVQNAPVGILIALFSLRLLKLRSDILWKKIIALSAAAVIMVSLFTYFSESPDIKVCNKYQTVFYGILKDSSEPAKDLEELGLDPGLSVLAGTNYFMESYPIDIKSAGFKKELYEKISFTKILEFYLRHPYRFFNKLEISANNAFKLKQGFGNFEKYPGIVFKQTSNFFGLWSDFKMKALPHTLLFLFLFYVVFVFVMLFEYFSRSRSKSKSSRLSIELLAVIGLIGLVGFVLPIVGDGEADIIKHLFLFNVCFDMMFMAGMVYAIRFLNTIFQTNNN